MKNKYYTYASLLWLVLIITVGMINKKDRPEVIRWSEQPLNWTNFQPVKSIEDHFDASIYSEISYPKTLDKDDSEVYAFMIPWLSERLKDSLLGTQLLKHEQYHFNITEYYARMLRKAIVEQGAHEITPSRIKDLYISYEEERIKMQKEYDEVSEHNLNQPKQLYWQLKIDDLLRQTAYYKNPDIYSYYNFTKEDTEYFRNIYITTDYKVLTSYPINKINSRDGECYQVIRTNKEVTIKFYKAGKLTNGGIFDTAITKIKTISDTQLEMHYYNEDETYNTTLERCISKTTWTGKDKSISYFDKEGEPVLYELIHSVFWKWEPDNQTIYATYYDLEGKSVKNKEQVYHKRKTFDDQGRTIKIAMFDVNHQPVLDNEYIAIYEYEFDEHHKPIQARLYDDKGDFAVHLEAYHTQYDYDERGNIVRYKIMDIRGAKKENKNGIAVYAYTYDINDNVTSTKRYNAAELPVLGHEDYFHEVTDYDAQNRLVFKARYYRDYVLAFNDNRNGASRYEYLNDSIYNIYNEDNYGIVFNNDEGIGIIKRYLNSAKQMVKEEYLDHRGCFAVYEDEIGMYLYSYDERGNQIEEKALDSLGQPVAIYGDATTFYAEYDVNNYKIKTAYLDSKGSPAEVPGVTTYEYGYNDQGYLIERKSFDNDHKPINYDGSFWVKYYPDKRGKDSLTKLYNTRNQLIRGAAIQKNKFNKYGNLIEETYYNSGYQRVSNYDGVSQIKHIYDDHQRYLGYKNYNQYDRPTNDDNGIFEERRTLDKAGNVISYEYFDKWKKPVLSPSGYHKIFYELDESHLIIRESIYGTNGKLINNTEGIAEYRYTRAPSGLAKSIQYYNANGELTGDKAGVAEIHYEPEMNGLYYTLKQLNASGEEIEELE